MTKKTIWKICCITVVIMAILTFTPLVTPVGRTGPEVMGVPYTMWVGFLQTVILVLITWVGTKVHPGFSDEEA